MTTDHSNPARLEPEGDLGVEEGPVGRRVPDAETNGVCRRLRSSLSGTLRHATQIYRRVTLDSYSGHLPAVDRHVVATFFGRPQSCLWISGDRRLEAKLRSGTVAVVPAWEGGTWSVGGPVESSGIFIPPSRLYECADMIGAGGSAIELIPRLGYSDSTIVSVFELLNSQGEFDDPSSRLMAEQAVDLLCTQLLRGHSTLGLVSSPTARRGLAEWQVKRVTTYMAERLGSDISLDELATLLSMSRFHFCTAFRLATGQTPYAWLTLQRIDRARELLAQSTVSVNEVGRAVGFRTASAFAARFRRIVGVPPSKYRRSR